jgi:DNA-binding protein Fis
MPLEDLEQRAIESALRMTGGNRTKAAAILGINRATLYNKLRLQ